MIKKGKWQQNRKMRAKTWRKEGLYKQQRSRCSTLGVGACSLCARVPQRCASGHRAPSRGTAAVWVKWLRLTGKGLQTEQVVTCVRKYAFPNTTSLFFQKEADRHWPPALCSHQPVYLPKQCVRLSGSPSQRIGFSMGRQFPLGFEVGGASDPCSKENDHFSAKRHFLSEKLASSSDFSKNLQKVKKWC